MCLTCSILYCSLWAFILLCVKIILVDLIYKTAGADLAFLFLAAFALSLDLTFLVTVLTLSALLFPFQFLAALHISRLCVIRVIIIVIIRIFLPQLCDHIENYQEQDNKSQNDQSLNALGSRHQITDKRDRSNDLRKVASNCYVNRLSL